MVSRARVVLAAAMLLGCAGGDDAPRHLVLVSLDTLGAQHVGAYGYARDTTPSLDRLAAEGALFERVYTPQTHTLTAHLSLFTGLHPRVHGASEDRVAVREAVSLAQVLAQAGFATAAFTTQTVYTSPRFGLGRGFQRFDAELADGATANALAAPWLRAQAERAAADPAHRIFLFVHYYEPHSDVGTRTPYAAPGEAQWRYLPPAARGALQGDTRLLTKLRNRGNVTPDQQTWLRAVYDAGVRHADADVLGALLGEIEALGLRDDALVVVTSDHGEEFYQHGELLHVQPYDETARVPLVLAGPGVPAGVRVDEVTELVDVMPTLLALLGLDAPSGHQGRDLTPLLRGGAVPAASALTEGFGERGRLSAIVAVEQGRRYAYVARVDERPEGGFATAGPGELYDLGADPEQQRDLAALQVARAARLEAHLLARFERNRAAAIRFGSTPASVELSPAERARLRGLGYAD